MVRVLRRQSVRCGRCRRYSLSGFFAKIPDVDRQDSTRVGQFCVSRVLVGRLDEAWKKTLQVFCRKRLMNLEQGIKRF